MKEKGGAKNKCTRFTSFDVDRESRLSHTSNALKKHEITHLYYFILLQKHV